MGIYQEVLTMNKLLIIFVEEKYCLLYKFISRCLYHYDGKVSK